MASTTDGFKIAEVDLELRGPGDFLGTRQHGLPDFRIASLIRATPTLAEARERGGALADLGSASALGRIGAAATGSGAPVEGPPGLAEIG